MCVVCRDNFNHLLKYILVHVFACALCLFICQMSQICSKMVNFLFSAYFDGHFCYHSNGKSQINARLLHFGYCSNKFMKILVKNNFYFLVS